MQYICKNCDTIFSSDVKGMVFCPKCNFTGLPLGEKPVEKSVEKPIEKKKLKKKKK